MKRIIGLFAIACLSGCATYQFPEHAYVPDPASRKDLQPFLIAADDTAVAILKQWNESHDPDDPINGGNFTLAQYNRTVGDGRQPDGTATVSVDYELTVPTGFLDGVNHFTVLVEKESGIIRVF